MNLPRNLIFFIVKTEAIQKIKEGDFANDLSLAVATFINPWAALYREYRAVVVNRISGLFDS